MQQFDIIGISDDRNVRFTDEVIEIIKNGTIFSGGKRHHEIVKSFLPEHYEWIDITVPLDGVFAEYKPHEHIVVFASGDPLFFGFGGTIQRRLPKAKLNVYPYFNSLQLLAHRAELPYENMRTISLTGRPWKALDKSLMNGEPMIGSLTDRRKTPTEIAKRMIDYGYDNYLMVVGECLGNSNERVRTMTLGQVVETTFEQPNCIILLRSSVKNKVLGISERDFMWLNGRDKMITKMPIRLLSLSQLDLSYCQVMWDVGFCTGSVSIECMLQYPHLNIIAFEKREEGAELMAVNSRRFGAIGIEAVIADFMALDLTQYTQPDAVFIGGHGGCLEEMIAKIYPNLKSGGVIVFNSVSENSFNAFMSGALEVGLTVEKPILITIDQFNPIHIMKATKS